MCGPVNRSPSHIETVSRAPKRKLENREQRLALQKPRSRAESLEIAEQRLRRNSLSRRNVGGAHTPGNNTAETGLFGCPSWIHIEPCASPRSLHSGLF